MAQLPTDQNQQENNNSISLTMITTKLRGLNVNAMEFITKDFDNTKTTTVSKTSTSTTLKEKKNSMIKRDIVRKKESINILFCGHVNAGKSTISGQLLYQMGQVDQRTLDKHQAEAREKSYGSFGRAWFETEKKHFIILDAPGHRHFVPNMIVGAAQADIAILVISARKGEFETGFERDGQTREHTLLVKTSGVRYLIILINKMDDPTVKWNQIRYDEIKDKLTNYLKKYDFKPDENTIFIPSSGLTGDFLKKHPGEELVPWFKGPTFIEYLDNLPSLDRNIDGPFRMPIVEKYREMGMIIMGKIESGCCRVGDRCVIMPNRTPVEVTNIYYEDIETDSCICGENVRLKLKNVQEEGISPGFILCDAEQELCHVGKVFDVQIAFIEHESIDQCKSLIIRGYTAVLHIYAASVDVQLQRFIALIDRKTGERTQTNPLFIRPGQVAIARFELSQTGKAICMEPFKHFPQLGRFTLREKDRTVAVGKILKIVN
ncbi:hypothetical protein I4U23_015537 [Adineta vaga]|nr:hypothetical protein I4U23_015537 [Adineta vaga]